MRSLMLLAILPLAACSGGHGDANAAGVPASGAGTSRTYAVSGFTGVALKGSDDADIRTGGAFSVRAQGPADMLDELVIEKDGDTLRIGRRSGGSFHWGGGRSVKVFVTMPRIDAATVSGSGDIVVDGAQGETFRASTSGSGDIRIAHLAVRTASLSVSGSGTLSAAGKADRAELSVQGSGDIDASNLTLGSATVSATGSGDVTASVNGPAQVSITGSGDVDLGANARCTVSKMGSGAVHCGQ